MLIIQYKSKKRPLEQGKKKRNLEFRFPCYDGREGETKTFWYGVCKERELGS
jgi:hypothetical protein